MAVVRNRFSVTFKFEATINSDTTLALLTWKRDIVIVYWKRHKMVKDYCFIYSFYASRCVITNIKIK